MGYTLGGLTRVWRTGVGINPEWHTLITCTHRAHGLVPTMAGPNPMQPPGHYLVPDDRDFFAVYRPRPGPVTVPVK